MTFLNVCYIFKFITNLISKHILSKKDIHFKTKTERLYRNEKNFDYAKKKNNQFYIDNNDDDDEKQNFESENEIFEQKEENQEKREIVLYQNNSVLYSVYRSQTIDIKRKTTQN